MSDELIFSGGNIGMDSPNDATESLNMYSSQYNLPDQKESYVDIVKGEVVDKKDLSPYDMIKVVAQQNNVKLRGPQKGCKHCYGRGYVGFDAHNNQPIPCGCIYFPKSPKEKEMERMNDSKKYGVKLSRKERRRYERRAAKQMLKNKDGFIKSLIDANPALSASDLVKMHEEHKKNVKPCLNKSAVKMLKRNNGLSLDNLKKS
jgi:hypothetical protein